MMETRTEFYGSSRKEIAEGIAIMEEVGWAVRQVIFPGESWTGVVVYEREKTND